MTEIRWEVPGGDAGQQLQGRSNLKWGRVKEIDAVKCLARVLLEDNDETMTYWMQVLHPKSELDKYYWMPDLEEPVTVLWDEDGEEGYIVGSLYNEKTLPRRTSEHETEVFWQDGTYIYYNREEHLMEINVKGTLRIVAENIEIGGLVSTRVEGGALALNAGGLVLVNNVPGLVIGSPDTGGFINISSGQAPAGMSIAPAKEI